MQGWSEEDVKEMVLAYVIRKPMLIERLVPARILLKQRRKYIQTEIEWLCAELAKITWKRAGSITYPVAIITLFSDDESFLKIRFHAITLSKNPSGYHPDVAHNLASHQ